jgi:hypothetical protein
MLTEDRVAVESVNAQIREALKTLLLARVALLKLGGRVPIYSVDGRLDRAVHSLRAGADSINELLALDNTARTSQECGKAGA